MAFENLAGVRFGKLVALSSRYCQISQKTMWRCICDCGAESTVRARSLKSGNTTSCGCASPFKLKHGAAAGTRTKTYQAWRSLRQRCNVSNAEQYPRYGGRGISVCSRWDSFENFLSDMGEAPRGLSIDRIDNDGDYEPGNCRWANIKTQNLNRSPVMMIELHGRTLCLSDWCKELGVVYRTACWRAKKLGCPKTALLSLAREIA